MKPDTRAGRGGSVEITVWESLSRKRMTVTASTDTSAADVVRSVSARMHLADSIRGGASGGSGGKLQAWAGGKQIDTGARIGDIEFEGNQLAIELKVGPD
jgi:hypothetical protein